MAGHELQLASSVALIHAMIVIKSHQVGLLSIVLPFLHHDACAAQFSLSLTIERRDLFWA
jgi:hypothetical protein